MMDERTALPLSWAWPRLEDVGANEKNAIVDGPFGSNLKLTDYVSDENGVPVLTTKNILDSFNRSGLRYVSQQKFEQLKRSQVRGGDILVAKIGSVGKNCIYPVGEPIALIPANLLKMTLNPEVDKLYIYYYLNSTQFKKQLNEITTATAQPAFNVSKFRRLIIPLAPSPEQRRIVAKIEELFSDLDAGVAELEKAKERLKRYRQAVLKAAVEGKLTAEWRAAHKREIEPAAVLLERIRKERAEKGNGKGKELPELDKRELGELPEGWEWQSLEALAANEPHSITDGPFGSNLKTEHYTESGPRVIRLQNIGDGVFQDAFAHISSIHFERLRKHQIFSGDIVIAGLGDSLPRSCVIPAGLGDAIVKADCIRVKPEIKITSSKYLNIVLNSEPLKKFAKEIIHGVGRPRMNQQQIKALPIAIAPLIEQEQIVGEVERRLSVADEIEKTVDASLQRAERLRQSILKKAFAGELVAQDPTDEPAERLLERIRAERDMKNTSSGTKQLNFLNATPKTKMRERSE